MIQPIPVIAAILLAAGESRRMGAFKQLLPFAGKTFVECCVDCLLASHVDEVVVVTGHRDADVRDALGNRRVRFVHNPEYRGGMSSSLIAGVSSLSDNTTAALISLVDQPLVEPDAVNAIIKRYLAERPLIVIPRFGGKNGHPVLVDMRLKDEIIGMDQDIGLKQVMRAHARDTLHQEMKDDSVLRDFDLPEDYEKIVRSSD